MKALIVASVASMIVQFNMNNIVLLQKLGYEVHVACNFDNPGTITKEKCDLLIDKLKALGVTMFQIDFSRSIFSIHKHFKAASQLKKVFKNNQYDLVHCHSPIGGMLTRLAAKKYRKRGLRVIYTAHGFHFYKGASFKNWLFFYPIEKMCSCWTDVLITINRTDYLLAQRKMNAKKVEYVPGVGIDIGKFSNTRVDKQKKKEELGIPNSSFLVLSVGELNTNKNHQIVIKAISKIGDSNIHYAIAGIGSGRDELEKLAKGLNVNLHLLGFRSDVAELYKTCDLFVLPSLREGLNVSLMESLASGTPSIASNIRGCVDVTNDVFNPLDVNDVAYKIMNHNTNASLDYVFSSDNVNKEMERIYEEI